MARKKARSAGNSVAAYDSPGSYKPIEERRNGPFDGYELRDALQTLAKAIKIRKNPALMKAIKAEANRQLAAAQSTTKALSGA